MEMKEAYKNERFKVLNVSLKAGESMPLHKASSDAFVINRKGKGRIHFSDKEVLLTEGETILIKANEPHKMDILEDFSSSIILEPEAKIDFV
ncbi:MAG: cupin domain-containing protein [Chitinophagaceae bacterium]|nr:cupin domain-containing protein [Chitinophagaceae bacterium]